MALQRRGMARLVVASLTVCGLVVALFIVDSALRAYAEGRVQQEISSNLPAGVTGDVSVSIDGVSVIEQYLSGTFARVDVTAPNLDASGVRASVRIVATDVPVDRTKTIGVVHGTVELSPQAVKTLVRTAGNAQGADLTLGNNEVSYSGSISLFGIPIGYVATATPTASDGVLKFTPTGARITTGAGSLDAGGIMQQVLGQQPISVCVAKYLPKGVLLTGTDVTPERARITLESTTLKLTKRSLTTLGAC